jgi:hypothetical protein
MEAIKTEMQYEKAIFLMSTMYDKDSEEAKDLSSILYEYEDQHYGQERVSIIEFFKSRPMFIPMNNTIKN